MPKMHILRPTTKSVSGDETHKKPQPAVRHFRIPQKSARKHVVVEEDGEKHIWRAKKGRGKRPKEEGKDSKGVGICDFVVVPVEFHFRCCDDFVILGIIPLIIIID